MRLARRPAVLAAAFLTLVPLTGATSAHANGNIVIDLDDPPTVVAHDTRSGSPTSSTGWVDTRAEQTFATTGRSQDVDLTVRAVVVPGNRVEASLYAGQVVHAEPFGTPGRYTGGLIGSGELDVTVGSAGYLDLDLGTDADLEPGETYTLVLEYLTGTGAARVDFSFSSFSGPGGLNLSEGSANPSMADHIRLDVALVGEPDPVAVTNSGTVGGDGWFVSDVTSTYSCLDGVTGCPTGPVVNTYGISNYTGTATFAGQNYTWSHSVRIDRTAPTVTGAIVASEEGDAPHSRRIDWTCTDAASGVDACPGQSYIPPSGVYDHELEATDHAGNTTLVDVDPRLTGEFRPVISLIGEPTEDATYPFGTTFTTTCTATSTAPGHVGAAVPCHVSQDTIAYPDGSSRRSLMATANDPLELGGITVGAVFWTVLGAPATPTPPGTPGTTPPVVDEPDLAVTVRGLQGLPTKAGHPVLKAGTSYKVTVRVLQDGEPVKRRPTWLKSVRTGKSGLKGRPSKVDRRFVAAKKGAWTRTFTAERKHAGEFRKYGVRVKGVAVVPVTVYVR